MKTKNWLNLDHHAFVVIDLMDGRRIKLNAGDRLIMAVDSVCVQTAKGVTYMFPSVQVAQIIKKDKKGLKR